MTGSVLVTRSFAARDSVSAVDSIILVSASAANCTCSPYRTYRTYRTHRTYRTIYKSYKSYYVLYVLFTMLPSPTATATASKSARASGAATGHAAETRRTLLVILRPVFGGDVLADDDNITL